MPGALKRLRIARILVFSLTSSSSHSIQDDSWSCQRDCKYIHIDRAMQIYPRTPNRAAYIGWITVSGTPAVRCYVEDLTPDGATIRVFASPVPDSFTLHFSRRGDAKVHCHVMWRNGARAGIRFVTDLAMYAPRRHCANDCEQLRVERVNVSGEGLSPEF